MPLPRLRAPGPMNFTFRWYGPNDPVSLAAIRQVPGVDGVVTALHDLPPGEVWTVERLRERQEAVRACGLEWSVVESIPVHESIKLGEPDRDAHIEAYAESIRNLGRVGIGTLCYNFMPVFDWLRTEFAMPLPDGSNTMQYVHADLSRFDLSRGMEALPAWAQGYGPDELGDLLRRYEAVDEGRLFDNLVAFLEGVVPSAEEAGVNLAIHPDDPPWSVFGLPRIVTGHAALQRLLDAVDHPRNGLTFCTGSLGASQDNDVVAMAAAFAPRTNFVHARNLRHTGPLDFYESAHPTRYGDVDLPRVLRALVDGGFEGPIRPDHGRMIWGETGTPGYGLYDRALGATYLQGVLEGLALRGAT